MKKLLIVSLCVAAVVQYVADARPASLHRQETKMSAAGEGATQKVVARGVGKDKADVVGYVLGKLSPELRNVLDKSIDAAAEAAATVVRNGPDFAMNAFNAFRVPET